MIGLREIQTAAQRIEPYVRRTPLLECAELGVTVKAENLQPTGSFKVRGVFNALLCHEELPRGVATFSAGNAGAAVAYAAKRLGIPSIVVMRPGSVPEKVAAIRSHGGEIVFTEDLFGTCSALCEERGFALLHPFDDLDLIAGHGTIGLEIGAADLVVVPVGGGGLISGIAAAMPGTRVVGVEPATANNMTYALAAGRPDPLPHKPVSIADGLTPPFSGEHTLEHVRALVADVVEVSEQSIRDAWWPLMRATRLLLEPSAVVGLAALRDGLIEPGERTVLVLSGGNSAELSPRASL
ncbi:threonine ammonia-lyase [Lentzea sp. NBRC 105346]|uniref:pyridoxal-phosphate dependent enzyme n=1 Tax=Lentzea sp. NBRC 105346 TaxID=3032205 RepID=UPI0024A3A905|nr:pyridoxal-phosphate dependent enzyme [Lentzea sp. NBRC 105346]GLZ33402.1 threonine ammonia-lyase [Lentzea sp. NBRC 105346]